MEGVAAEVEESVVEADAVELEDFAPFFGEEGFEGGARGGEFGVECGAGAVGRGEGVAVDFAVGGEGKNRELYDRAGLHRGGEFFFQKCAEVGWDGWDVGD